MPAYTFNVPSGLWSVAANWSPVGVPNGTADTVTIGSGRVCELDMGTMTIGTGAGNAITLTGAGSTLRFSRSVGNTLTVNGNISHAAGTIIDMGTASDRITAVDAIMLFPIAGVQIPFLGNVLCAGVQRTRHTTTTAAITAGASSFNVAAAANWAPGDLLALIPNIRSTNPLTNTQVVTIAGSYSGGLTIPITGTVTVARNSGAVVVNLTSNVRLGGAGQTWRSTNVAPKSLDSEVFLDTAIYTRGQAFQPYWTVGGGAVASGYMSRFEGCAIYTDGGAVNGASLTVNRGGFVNNCGIVSLANSSSGGLNKFQGDIVDSVVAAVAPVLGNLGPGGTTSTCSYWALAAITTGIPFPSAGIGERYENCSFYSLRSGATQAIAQLVGAGAQYVNCSFDELGSETRPAWNYGIVGTSTLLGIGGRVTMEATVLPPIAPNFTPGVIPDCEVLLKQCERSDALGSPFDEILMSAATGYPDTSVRLNSNKSFRWNISATGFNQQLRESFTIAPGQTRRIRVNLRRDTTYGSGFMPRVTLSVPGETDVSTSAPDVANVWHPQELSITNSGAAVSTCTITLETQGTNLGLAYFDGLPWPVFVDAARWYGDRFGDAATEGSPFREADPTITIPEATVAAYTGISVDHGTQTITISAPFTNQQVYHWLTWDLCQTANLTVPKHVTALVPAGFNFATTYTINFTGSGSISGRYTDATGSQVFITAPNLISGTRVQVFNVTDSVEIANEVIGAGGFSMTYFSTTAKTMRLRATYAVGTDARLPIQALGVIDGSDLTFADTQAPDLIYNTNAIDGSAVTEFAADYPNVQVDINDPDGTTSVQRLYAWHVFNETTAAGVADFFGAVVAEDEVNYVIRADLITLTLDNVNPTPVKLVGGYLRRSDGETFIAATSGSIQPVSGRAYIPASVQASTAAAVWSAPTRTLTANPGLDAAAVQAAAAAAIAAAEPIDATVVNVSAVAGAAADAVWAEELEPGFSASRELRVAAAAIAGKVTGGPAGFTARNLSDTADQVTGTADADGNRTSATYGA